MDYLVDTHAIIWFSENNPKLSQKANKQLSDLRNNCYISLASIWEMAIKLKIGKPFLDMSLSDFIAEIQNRDFHFLPIKIEHVIGINELDLFHNDPFDRLLISQTILENFPIISRDTIFDKYGIKRIW